MRKFRSLIPVLFCICEDNYFVFCVVDVVIHPFLQIFQKNSLGSILGFIFYFPGMVVGGRGIVGSTLIEGVILILIPDSVDKLPGSIGYD